MNDDWWEANASAQERKQWSFFLLKEAKKRKAHRRREKNRA